MSFGRKGLAPGQTAPAATGGFGRGGTQAAQSAPPVAEIDDIAAKREAFIASERARRTDEIGEGSLPSPEALAGLHNSSRPAARRAERIGGGPVGETGLPVHQEEQIRAAARGMSGGYAPPPARRTGGYSGRAPNGEKFLFGDPAGRSLGIAYLIWFVIGQTGMHRVYCGSKDTAIIQVGLLVGSFVTLFVFAPIGAIGFVAWICWIIGDLFMMPGMLRRFKAKHSYDAGVFS